MKRLTLSRKHIVAAITILIALVVGVAVIVVRHNSSPGVATREVITYSTDTPGEEKPTSEYVWRGLPSDPKYIDMPTINVGGYVQGVGKDQYGAVAVPNNIHMAGWFVDILTPGQSGLSVIDGYVTGRKNDGIFKDLGKLQKGDVFTVEFGNGSKKSFQVEDVVTRKVAETADVLFSQQPDILAQLNLITCGGNFDQQANRYEDRIVAITKLIEE